LLLLLPNRRETGGHLLVVEALQNGIKVGRRTICEIVQPLRHGDETDTRDRIARASGEGKTLRSRTTELFGSICHIERAPPLADG